MNRRIARAARFLCLTLALIVACGGFTWVQAAPGAAGSGATPTAVPAEADEPVPTDPQPTPGASAEAAEPTPAPSAAPSPRSDTLRVYLKSLGAVSTLRLTLQGDYTVGEGTGFRFDSGTKLTMTAQGGSVWMRLDGLTVNLGASVTLERHASDGPSGLYIDGSAKGGLYQGALTLRANGDWLEAVLLIDIEDYLKGVVPYEMNDAFPAEALKAQAVAARTYALWRRAARVGAGYDVVDTPADQVFYGWSDDNPNAAAAVDATRGVSGTYHGAYAATYYTATNGGQTALAGDILGAKENDGYLDVREDPYDLENPMSPIKTLAIERDFLDAPQPLIDALRAAAAPAMEDLGCSADPEDISPLWLVSAEVMDPMHGTGSLQYRTVRLRYTVSARAMEPAYAEPTAEQLVRAAVTGAAYEREQIGMAPGAYVALDETFTCDLDVYDDLKDQLGLGLSGIDCELCSVIEEEDIVVIQLKRYGHGVGMSQRGAQRMAGHHGMTYDQILSFYYPGLDFAEEELESGALPALDESPLS